MAYFSVPESAGGSSTSDTLQPEAVLSGAASSIGFSGLDGDADGGYHLEFQLINAAAGSTNVRLQVNGASTNLTWARVFGGDTAATGDDDTNGTFAAMQHGSDTAKITIDVDARTGVNRHFDITFRAGTTVAYRAMVATVIWHDDNTNITAIGLDDAAGTNRFAADSKANIWRIPYGGL